MLATPQVSTPPSSNASVYEETLAADEPSTSLSYGFGTRAIHVGSDASPESGAVIPAISLSTTYKQDAIGVHKGFEYTRSDNPNRRALETLLASIEAGGATALATSSGSSATGIIISSLGPNAHVLSVNDVYGGTARYLTKVASVTQSLQTTFVDLENSSDEEIASKFQDNTKLVWIETPTNPTLRVIDVPRIVRLASEAPSKPLVLVDNTFLSPFYQSPLLLGADLVMHSITKYINGHSDVLMGAIILPSPNPSKPSASDLDARLRFLQNATGAVPGAYDCWLAQRGIKTLHLRMKAHGTNALALAKWLSTAGIERGLVKEVIYPGLRVTSRGRFDLVRSSLIAPHALEWIEKGKWEGFSSEEATREEGVPYGGMLSFVISPSLGAPAESAAERFLTSTKLFTLAESLGGVESLAELPAKMTHAGIPVAEREALGISDGLVRLSVGVEDVDDLVTDVERALEYAVKGSPAVKKA